MIQNEPDRPLPDGITPELVNALASKGYAIVPVEPTAAILGARDDDGDEIFCGGTEHYFRNTDEGHWYGRQVWRAMMTAARIYSTVWQCD